MENNHYDLSGKTIIFDATDQSLTSINDKLPELNEGEILVRNEFVTLCKSDLNTYAGVRKEKNPTILGHEIVGRIAAFYENIPSTDDVGIKLAIGDRITWGIYASDPNSRLAKQGIPQKGENLFKYGHEQYHEQSTFHGGLSEYTIIRKFTPVVKLEESVPLKIAAIINCAVATVAGAFRLAGDVQNKKVLILGVGMLGITACAFAASSGAKSVAASDIDVERLKLAYRFGADGLFEIGDLQSTAEQQKFDVIMDFSGMPESMELSLKRLKIGGTTVWVGATFPQRPLNIEAEQVVRNLHIIKGLHNYNRDDLLTAVEFITKNHSVYPFAELIKDGFTLDETQQAFDFALNFKPFRAGITI